MTESQTPTLLAGASDIGNADVDWDRFDSAAYFKHNYQMLRPDDAKIIEVVSDYFASTGPARWPARALDIGSGSNLYPALTMLPFSSQITLTERAFSNREWLKDALQNPQDSWWRFWEVISRGRADYSRINAPLEVLAGRAEIRKGNIFSLARDQFDIGTMFFVAESITTRNDEFRRATQCFVRALTTKAPFAAAFMRGSTGYPVGSERFPASAVDESDVRRALSGIAHIDALVPIASEDLRAGYSGMMVAVGRRK